MSKSAVYSWRLSPELKEALEDAARRNEESVARLLEHIVREWLARSEPDEEDLQRRLHASAAPFLGAIEGVDPNRAATVRRTVRERLTRRHRRSSSVRQS